MQTAQLSGRSTHLCIEQAAQQQPGDGSDVCAGALQQAADACFVAACERHCTP